MTYVQTEVMRLQPIANRIAKAWKHHYDMALSILYESLIRSVMRYNPGCRYTLEAFAYNRARIDVRRGLKSAGKVVVSDHKRKPEPSTIDTVSAGERFAKAIETMEDCQAKTFATWYFVERLPVNEIRRRTGMNWYQVRRILVPVSRRLLRTLEGV